MFVNRCLKEVVNEYEIYENYLGRHEELKTRLESYSTDKDLGHFKSDEDEINKRQPLISTEKDIQKNGFTTEGECK